MQDYTQVVQQLTQKLVKVPSIVGSTGEWDMAKVVYEQYQGMAYFDDNPEQLVFMPVDEHKRANVLAMIQGKKEEDFRQTIVLMSHLDTVGIEDYGDLSHLAFDSAKLKEALKRRDLNKRAAEDLAGEAYEFGRGILDNKSGVAAVIEVFRYFAEHPEELKGTLIVLHECDEEGNAEGIMAALERLGQWQDEYGLEFIGAINANYSTPKDNQDEKKAVYFGSVGKMLPTFYVVGKGAHVGEAFNGFDPNLLLSAIAMKLSYNPDFCEYENGELAMPPVSLKQMDLKGQYNVQTPLEAYGYYNYFTMGTEPNKIISKMKDVAKEAFTDVIKMMKLRYQRYCQLKKLEPKPLPWEVQVYSWEEFSGDIGMVHGEKYNSYMRVFAENLLEEHPELDLREFNLAMVREAWYRWGSKKAPVVIVFNSSTYYPPVILNKEDKRHRRLMEAAEIAAKKVAGEEVEMRFCYPYISDASFLYQPRASRGMLSIKANTPGWGYVYEHPVSAIEQISMPVINMGPWGCDGLQMTERVEKNYAYSVLPKMIHETVLQLSQQE